MELGQEACLLQFVLNICSCAFCLNNTVPATRDMKSTCYRPSSVQAWAWAQVQLRSSKMAGHVFTAFHNNVRKHSNCHVQMQGMLPSGGHSNRTLARYSDLRGKQHCLCLHSQPKTFSTILAHKTEAKGTMALADNVPKRMTTASYLKGMNWKVWICEGLSKFFKQLARLFVSYFCHMGKRLSLLSQMQEIQRQFRCPQCRMWSGQIMLPSNEPRDLLEHSRQLRNKHAQ